MTFRPGIGLMYQKLVNLRPVWTGLGKSRGAPFLSHGFYYKCRLSPGLWHDSCFRFSSHLESGRWDRAGGVCVEGAILPDIRAFFDVSRHEDSESGQVAKLTEIQFADLQTERHFW